MNNEWFPEKIAYPKIASELEAMAKVDRDMRAQDLKDTNLWDDSVDRNNTARLKEIVAEIGWPTRSKVGEVGMNDAWLLVQHADRDVDFQNQCLNLMKAESPEEVGLRNIAYLEDRVRVNQGREQLYGTQFLDKDGEYGPRPIEDPEHVDERRAEMGLETMAEYTKHLREKYGFPL